MSRPSNYWYGIAKKMVYRYPKLAEESAQEALFKAAIEAAIKNTGQEMDGDEKVRAIKLVCFDKYMTVDGVAMQMNYSRNTVQRWINRFINQVGRNAGF